MGSFGEPLGRYPGQTFNALELNMSVLMGWLLYLALGLALSALRVRQNVRPADALFAGLFWPLDQSRRWIEAVVGVLVKPGWEGEGA